MTSGAGSYATAGMGVSGPIYGNARILPLIGGSGGAGRTDNPNAGGAGGGAMLVVVGQNFRLTGVLYASGGASGTAGGSGGAFRIVADTLAGNGAISAAGATGGGNGRVRVEANVLTFSSQSAPAYSARSRGRRDLAPRAGANRANRHRERAGSHG